MGSPKFNGNPIFKGNYKSKFKILHDPEWSARPNESPSDDEDALSLTYARRLVAQAEKIKRKTSTTQTKKSPTARKPSPSVRFFMF